MFLIYKEIQNGAVAKSSTVYLTASSYCIWGNNCAFLHIKGSPSSYITLQLHHSEFPDIWRKFVFFYQCTCKFGNVLPFLSHLIYPLGLAPSKFLSKSPPYIHVPPPLWHVPQYIRRWCDLTISPPQTNGQWLTCIVKRWAGERCSVTGEFRIKCRFPP